MVEYSVGIVTAYGAAVRGGYTGTYEEFCRQQAQYADNAEAVEQAKQTAVSNAQVAYNAAQTADQANTQAQAASTAAQSASQLAGQSAQDAQTAESNASTHAQNAASAAGSAQASAAAAQAVKDSIPQDYTELSSDVTQLKADLNTSKNAMSVETKIDATWAQGYVKNDTGGIGSDPKSCYTTFIESKGGEIILTVGSGYRTKVALYNASKVFESIILGVGSGDRSFVVGYGNFVRVQVSSDSSLGPWNINDSVITIKEKSYTDTNIEKKSGKPADAKQVFDVINGMLCVDTGEQTIVRGYYNANSGEQGNDSRFARTNKIENLSGKTVFASVGSGYKFAVRMWNGDEYDKSKKTDYVSNGIVFIPSGYTIAFSFQDDAVSGLDSEDYAAIKSSFHIYVSGAEQFTEGVIPSGTDFHSIHTTGTYRATSGNAGTYINAPTNDYGRLIVFSTPDNYSIVHIYITFKNEVYTNILQMRDTDIWSGWSLVYNDKTGVIGSYLHDGDIIKMASNPDAIPVNENHLGYTDFMAATWETLLPSGYTDGDSYDASTTKIINVHVSRQTNWQSTAYGSNTDTYPIYRYMFTPVNGYSKTVFLSAGCHGNEAEGYWGLYRLMKMIYFEGYKYPTLRNLRDNVRFIIVPCWNPWGMQNYRRYNAFESNNLQAYRWLYATDNTITVDGTDYSINDVGEAKVIWDTITNYSDVIDLWLEIHTDPYAGRTTSAGEIDDPRGYTQPYGCYGFVKRNSRVHYRLQAVMEDFYNILLGEYNFTEKWHLVSSNGDASGASGYSPWMASLSFPTALVEISTFMNGFPHASGSAGMMKLAQEYYGNCLAELLR